MSTSEHIESALNRLIPKFSTNHGSITALQRLSGGASQEIWSFEGPPARHQSQRYILRRAPGGERPVSSDHTLTLRDEALLLQAVGKLNPSVPKVAYICVPGDGLGMSYIMEFVDGETIARKIQRNDGFTQARANFARDCGTALAIIHNTPLDELPALKRSSGTDQLDHYEDIYRQIDIPRPAFALAFQTLRKSAPDPGQPVLVHGDFRLGNLMIGEEGLRAVLDWELSHLGDPREDIGWICVNSWRFGASENRVGGIGQLDEFLTAYKTAGGADITAEEIGWWEMLGTLKWGIMCMIMYDTYRTGGDTSVERVAIGRRVSETEIDLINLMEGI